MMDAFLALVPDRSNPGLWIGEINIQSAEIFLYKSRNQRVSFQFEIIYFFYSFRFYYYYKYFTFSLRGSPLDVII